MSEKGTWYIPVNYTKKLSGIITLSRALVLLKVWTRATESSKSGSESGSKSESTAANVYREVRRLYPKTIVLTQYTGKSRPFNWIWHIRNYGKAIAAGTSQKGTAEWIGNKLIY